MDEVSMHDGFDAPETIAFGLGAAETGVLVIALLSAYAVAATLPGALAWPAAAVLAGCGALLAWERHEDRSLLAWAVLLGRFGWRHRGRAPAALRRRRGAVAAEVRRLVSAHREQTSAPGGDPRPAADDHTGDALESVVIRLVQPLHAPPPAAEVCRRARSIGFVALRGGSGCTALACEVAALLAARGRATDGAGWRPLRVVLLDVDPRLPAATVRLGIPLAGDGADDGGAAGVVSRLVRHRSGLLVLPGSARPVAEGALGRTAVAELVAGAEQAGADVVVIAGCDLGAAGSAAVELCDDIAVVLDPTPGGILDAYWTTAALRRMGLRDRLLHVATRCAEDADLAMLESDLAVEVRFRVPADPALDAAAAGQVTALDAAACSAASLVALAAHLNHGVLHDLAADVEEWSRWGGRAG